MNTQFSLFDRTLSLIRYPARHQHKSLQAWDSADELLITEIQQDATQPEGQCIIFNDDFGALGCWFADERPFWVSDSWIAQRSLLENLEANTAQYNQPPAVHYLTSMDPLPQAPAMVLIKIPRTLALLEHQLIALRQVVTANTRIIAAGKVKSITRSVLALFERYIGPTQTSLAVKKSRLIFTTVNSELCARPVTSPYPTTWSYTHQDGTHLSLTNHANVFSRQSLDIGARLMLGHMQADNSDRLIDLGCGNGILGLSALAQAPQCQVTFVDESFMALASARENVQTNFPERLPQCEFVASNCLETLLSDKRSGEFTKVLCNPPFHQQNTITDHIAWQMFHDAREALGKGGHLIVVANRHLDYHHKLKRLFGGVKLLASDKKFVILSAAKR
ncbi:methyltransferase domain-containing protein [Alteromonas aestuariivivens]|uniref:Ribosomal RNA large subunit methyltransferase G n=1 Tax=Alteromonas aestuariivivens TaxID=1938339 RepID=A0A3D8MC64_9ALTE|nr:methyltransferase [Alteromonas aestuariivivens]RDV28012.1 methyltransferase domain-containing protein [Alteromonas aestuariivivens]